MAIATPKRWMSFRGHDKPIHRTLLLTPLRPQNRWFWHPMTWHVKDSWGMSMFDVYLGKVKLFKRVETTLYCNICNARLPEIEASSVLALSRKGIRKSESHVFVHLVNILCLNIANTYYVHKLQLKATGYLQLIGIDLLKRCGWSLFVFCLCVILRETLLFPSTLKALLLKLFGSSQQQTKSINLDHVLSVNDLSPLHFS